MLEITEHWLSRGAQPPLPTDGSEEGGGGCHWLARWVTEAWAWGIAKLAFARMEQRAFRWRNRPRRGVAQHRACVEVSRPSGWLELRVREGLQGGV